MRLAESKRFHSHLAKALEGVRQGALSPEDLAPLEGRLEVHPLTPRSLEEALHLADGERAVLLTPLRKGRHGSVLLGERKAKLLGLPGLYAPGSRLVAVESDPHLGVVNGEVFTVVRVEGGHLLTQEGPVIPPHKYSLFQGAYALTVHRAQGSEWPVVFVLLPQEGLGVVDRRWLYTALTRGRERVVVLAEGDAFWRALAKPPAPRQTLLRHFLKHFSRSAGTLFSEGRARGVSFR